MRRPLSFLLLAAALPAQEPEVRADVATCVLESAEDRAWRRIPWRSQFAAAVLEADQVERPVLLWAMNGHPLGCT